MPADTSLDLKDLIKKFVFDEYGIGGLIGLACIAAAAYLYKNWDSVQKWPGIGFLVKRISRAPIPVADPNRFSVMMAHLEHDASGEYEQLIVEELKEFKGLQVLRLDRCITLEGPVPEEAEKKGHKSARYYLDKSGSSVLIWGTIIKCDNRTVPKLYWTAAAGKELKAKQYGVLGTDAELRMPQFFWSDLRVVLGLLIASRAVEVTTEDEYVAELPQLISRVRTLVAAADGRPDWTFDSMASTYSILAAALYVYGRQTGYSQPIEEAISIYRKLLKVQVGKRVPLDWAATQNNLGLALWTLGERESGTTRIEEAVQAFRAALVPYFFGIARKGLETVSELLAARRQNEASDL